MKPNINFIFIADLHLSPSATAKTNIFLRLLERYAAPSNHLFILGDLFEYWVGDDDINNPLFSTVVPALRALTDAGAKLSLMRGNRDFLMGEQLAGLTHGEMLSDPHLIEIHGEKTLLSHGDQWCTDDTEYQAIRSIVRSNQWIDDFVKLPISERNKRAQSYREKSDASKEKKIAEIMDVSIQTVDEAFETYNCRRIIHGHTHRHAHHKQLVNEQTLERFVLADWRTRGQALVINESGYLDQFFD
ncbi:MAG: UDP-2,3-diacylglucosamine diphosphatase [Burkholderiales bacterium]|mgnify:CR=1 FL=1|jgi:UDP-2,3-diacylglucosamine hydrolase|tara:strand:- start:27756 stop:28490 length:735 start_codon:yes stop_codon:yes gene_type:complete